MRPRFALISVLGTIVTAACLGWSAPGLAAQATTLTSFRGVVSGPNGPNGVVASGTHTRTITDVTGPNGPYGEKVLASYPVNINWFSGMTASQYADAYQAACNATLPGPMTGPNGYGTARENRVVPMVRLSKQSGTYDFSDVGIPTGIIVTTFVPSTAEDAPAASTAALASLVACLSLLAYRARRRRPTA